MNYFEKVGAHHVDCDGDDGGDVSDGGDVEDSHDLPCKLSIHLNMTDACTRTDLNIICLYYCCGFLLLLQVFAKSIFFIFLIYIFWIHGHPPHIRKRHDVSVLLST